MYSFHMRTQSWEYKMNALAITICVLMGIDICIIGSLTA